MANWMLDISETLESAGASRALGEGAGRGGAGWGGGAGVRRGCFRYC